MFAINTIVEGRQITVATRTTRAAAEAYVTQHAHGCLALFVTDNSLRPTDRKPDGVEPRATYQFHAGAVSS